MVVVHDLGSHRTYLGTLYPVREYSKIDSVRQGPISELTHRVSSTRLGRPPIRDGWRSNGRKCAPCGTADAGFAQRAAGTVSRQSAFTSSPGPTLGRRPWRAIFGGLRGDSAQVLADQLAAGAKVDSSRWWLERWADGTLHRVSAPTRTGSAPKLRTRTPRSPAQESPAVATHVATSAAIRTHWNAWEPTGSNSESLSP